MKNLLLSLYVFVLCATAGAIFTLGAMVAPVLFHAEALTKFEAGVLMSQVFGRLNNAMMFCLICILLFEGWMIASKQLCKTALSLAVFAAIFILAFVAYLTPQVLLFQQQGASALASQEFENLHRLSEIDFKLLLAALVMLAFVRLSRALGSKTQNSCDSKSIR